MNQFFDDIIICFDGDESGYKAALRAAENAIKELQPDLLRLTQLNVITEDDENLRDAVSMVLKKVCV